jgi:hypothetical protein
MKAGGIGLKEKVKFPDYCPVPDPKSDNLYLMINRKRKTKMKKHLAFLLSVFCTTLLIVGCKLTISTFTAPDTAETGEIITLTIEGSASDGGDGATEYGIILQLPENWEVTYSSALVISMFSSQYEIYENSAYSSLYTAEPGYRIWVGTALVGGANNASVTATLKVLTGTFSGNAGTIQNYKLKAVAGALRNGVWASDDPQGIFNFASVTNDTYVEPIAVTKVTDQTPPPSVSQLTVTDKYNGTDVILSWNYDESTQKDLCGYRIYQSTSYFTNVNGMAYIAVDSGISGYNISGLTQGRTYYFAVTAVDEVPNENKTVTPASVTTRRLVGAVTGRAYEYKCVFISCGNYGLQGATVSVSNALTHRSFITGSDGYYTFSDLPIGNYSVIVSKEGYGTGIYSVDVLENQTVDVVDSALEAATSTYIINGYVKDINNNGIAGVIITNENGEILTSASSWGYYTFTVSSGWSGTVTPEKSGYSFTPVSSDYQNVTAQKYQNYTAVAESSSFVSRQFSCYSPGSKTTVSLIASPAAGINNYALEDIPPAGWIVSNVSSGGMYDAANHKVKFGPFFDSTSRIFTYDATAPANESGEKMFSGTASADAYKSSIGGSSVIDICSGHPADVNPADSVMSIGEVTTYGSAWKNGSMWQNPPNPIPVSYVTRAGFLWKNGENYRSDPSAGTCPLCWVNASGRSGTERADEFSAIRQLPAIYQPGQAFSVSIAVNPGSVSSYAVEEQPPAGWTVSNINYGGSFDAVNKFIKYGPFMDQTVRTLTYQITPSATAFGAYVFSGTASYDGHDFQIIGNRMTGDRAGDMDRDKDVDLKDLIMVLKTVSGNSVSGVSADADVNNDQRIGIPDAIYILQILARLR